MTPWILLSCHFFHTWFSCHLRGGTTFWLSHFYTEWGGVIEPQRYRLLKAALNGLLLFHFSTTWYPPNWRSTLAHLWTVACDAQSIRMKKWFQLHHSSSLTPLSYGSNSKVSLFRLVKKWLGGEKNCYNPFYVSIAPKTFFYPLTPLWHLSLTGRLADCGDFVRAVDHETASYNMYI